jgi:hypothetical protein
MSISKRIFEEHEERVAAITKIAVDLRALILDESADELSSAENPDADKMVYAAAFHAWIDGKINGTAEEIVEATQEALEV